MTTPRSAARHYRSQQALTVATIAAAQRAWRAMTADFDASFPNVLPKLLTVLSAAQLSAARAAHRYVAEVLEELGIDAPAQGELNPRAFAGTASDGRPLDTLLYGPVTRAKRARKSEPDAPGASVPEALQQGEQRLKLIVQGEIADANRTAVETVIASRTALGGYVRMVNLPACGRCIQLAGQFYRWNEGFARHPGCDCKHIPASEDTADEVRTDPRKAFEAMTPDQQDKAFTKDGAEAIRLGADISQVVNARRGMKTTVLHRRDVAITSAGTTRRGVYGGSESAATGGYTATRVGRRGYIKNQVERRANRARLMPETILEHAEDRDDAIRLLKLYGFITD